MPVPWACGVWASSKKKRGSPSSVLRTALWVKVKDVPTKVPDQSPPPSMPARVEQDEVAARFAAAMVAVGGVEVAEVVGGCRVNGS